MPTSCEVRIAHASDLHLGARPYTFKREKDIYDAFKELVEKVVEERVDYLLLSGDIFDEPVPRNAARRQFRLALRRLKEKGIRVLGILGDHDRPKRFDLPPTADLFQDELTLLEYSPVPGTFLERFAKRSFVNEERCLYITGFCSRWKDEERKKEIQKALPSASKEASKYKLRILMLHQAVREFFPFDSTAIPLGWITGSSFQYFAMGHIHRKIERSIDGSLLVYPGAIEIHRIDEVGDKGFYLVDLSSEGPVAQFVKLDSVRPQYVIEVDEQNLVKEVESRLGGKEPIFHLIAKPNANKAKIQQLVADLERQYKRTIYLIRLYFKSPEEVRGEVKRVETASLDEIVEKYGGELKDIILKILKTARETNEERWEEEFERILMEAVK